MDAIAPERKALIGASIPRSGHHFLQRILSLYFEGELHYCEWYTPKDCCKQVPCSKLGSYRLTYQKSHDWNFELTQQLTGVLYLVQYRHPVPEALSDRELIKDRIGRQSMDYRLSKDAYAWWLASKAIYYRRFHQKWFEHRVPNAVYLDYSALSDRAAESVEPIIRWVAGAVDDNRLASAVQQASGSRGASPLAAQFKPRVIQKSPYYDPDLLAPFEAYVLHRCPKFEFNPEFSGSFADHSLYGLILAQDPDEPLPNGEQDRLSAAAHLAPGHPEIAFRLAKRDLKQGATERAISTLEAALERNPHFGQGYRLLAQTCKTAGRPLPASTTGSDALFACTKNPGALVDIAAAMIAEHKPINALAALSIAAVLQPENYRANYLLAKTLASQGRWEQARYYAERAAQIRPDGKQNVRLLAKIRDHLDRVPVPA